MVKPLNIDVLNSGAGKLPLRTREMWMWIKVEPALDVTDATRVVGDHKNCIEYATVSKLDNLTRFGQEDTTTRMTC